MWMKPGKPVGNPCGQARGQAKPVHRLSISGCPRAEQSEPGGRAAIVHISTGPGFLFVVLLILHKGLRFLDWRLTERVRDSCLVIPLRLCRVWFRGSSRERLCKKLRLIRTC